MYLTVCNWAKQNSLIYEGAQKFEEYYIWKSFERYQFHMRLQKGGDLFGELEKDLRNAESVLQFWRTWTPSWLGIR